MQTLVTVYDDQNILNLTAGFHVQPDQIIFLYEPGQIRFIRNITIHKYLKGNISYIEYTSETLPGVLKNICESENEIIFDGTGGNDYAIAYMSRLAEEKGYTVVCPDLEEKKILQITKDGLFSEDLRRPRLTVKDIVRLYGGEVRNLREAKYDETGRNIVYFCLEYRRKYKKQWHQFCNIMSKIAQRQRDDLRWSLELKLYHAYQEIFDGLRQAGCLESIFELGKEVYFTVADADYVQLITDVGVPFEYDVYYQLCDSGVFDDVDIRVNIDWNGGEFVGHDPESELDVVAVKDATLISISCKSGDFDSKDLYEVKVNADKFGGTRSLAVLADDAEIDVPGLEQKALELNVLLILYRDIRAGRTAEMILRNL